MTVWARAHAWPESRAEGTTTATLAHFTGDRKRAAEALGISLKALYNRNHRVEGQRRLDDTSRTG